MEESWNQRFNVVNIDLVNYHKNPFKVIQNLSFCCQHLYFCFFFYCILGYFIKYSSCFCYLTLTSPVDNLSIQFRFWVWLIDIEKVILYWDHMLFQALEMYFQDSEML